MAGQGDSQTFLFADLAGFTALTSAMGDESAADVAADFSERVRELASDHGSECIKAIGDAVMVRSTEAVGAIRLAICLANDVGGRHFFPTVRVGMHTGPAIERDGDWFGGTVNLAARVSGEARGGEVLLTDTTRDAAGTVEGIELREHGRRVLKNIHDPVVLYAAAPEGKTKADGLPMDPVCRMAVDPTHCAGILRHKGTEYHFCSLACASAFGADPARFTE